jgi:CpeT/CpcT family (DUF1001)
MARLLCFVLLFPFIVHAQKFTAADVQRLRVFSTGSFSNAVQTKAEKDILAASIQLQPIWQKRKDGAWIFVQLQDTSMKYAIWHYYIQDDTTLVLQFFDFKEKEKALQVSRDIKKQSTLKIFNLITKRGCEVYFKKDKLQYSGSSTGKDCFSENKNIEYYSYKVAVAKNKIYWWEAAYGKEDKTLFSTPGNGYYFTRQIKTSK